MLAPVSPTSRFYFWINKICWSTTINCDLVGEHLSITYLLYCFFQILNVLLIRQQTSDRAIQRDTLYIINTVKTMNQDDESRQWIKYSFNSFFNVAKILYIIVKQILQIMWEINILTFKQHYANTSGEPRFLGFRLFFWSIYLFLGSGPKGDKVL